MNRSYGNKRRNEDFDDGGNGDFGDFDDGPPNKRGRNSRDNEHHRKIFIGGLSTNTTEETLKSHFEDWGEIVDCVVMRDPNSKRSRGFGFITYREPEMVDKAQENRPHTLDGKEVETKRATPREESNKPEARMSIKKVFVGGIKEEIDEEDLREYFCQFGNILSVDVITDKSTGKKRGFAFVQYDDYDPVDKIVLRKSHMIKNKRCDVKKALSKDEMKKAEAKGMSMNSRQGGFGGGMGGGFGGFGGGMGGGFGNDGMGGRGGRGDRWGGNDSDHRQNSGRGGFGNQGNFNQGGGGGFNQGGGFGNQGGGMGGGGGGFNNQQSNWGNQGSGNSWGNQSQNYSNQSQGFGNQGMGGNQGGGNWGNNQGSWGNNQGGGMNQGNNQGFSGGSGGGGFNNGNDGGYNYSSNQGSNSGWGNQSSNYNSSSGGGGGSGGSFGNYNSGGGQSSYGGNMRNQGGGFSGRR